MKIVLMVDWFLYYAVELANALAEEHEVMLITRDHNYEISSQDCPVELDEFLDECLDKRVLRERLRFRLSNLKSLNEVMRIYKIIKAFSPDVVHIQENTDWRILLIAKMFGFEKVVLTVHDIKKHPGDPGGIMRIIGFILRKKAGKVIVHGNYLKKQLLSKTKMLKRKIHVVPHGAFSIYKKWDDEIVKEEEHTILFFGRISKYKGIDVLIKAEPIISKEIPDVRIIIAGRGEGLRKYENLIINRQCFEIHNRFISNAEVPRFFRRASVIILPYTEASQSGIIPIAYVFGKPVVVSNVGSIPEVVEDGKTGFVVQPNSPDDLGDAIANILKNKELKKKMSENALMKALTDLSWINIARKTAKIYTFTD